jgi:mersacidin/lichenicidin family type 2 lantibiotic
MSVGKAASGNPRYAIAELYRHWALDELVEVAHAISFDFVSRPTQYRHIPEDIGDTLANFHASTGSQPDWPDTSQRLRIYLPIVGGAFCSAGAGLREAAISFLKQSTSENRAVLHQFVFDKAMLLRAHLNMLEGRSLSVADKHTSAVFQKAVDVLRCPEVCRIFGVESAPRADWPFGVPFSEDGAILCEEVSRTLRLWSERIVRSEAKAAARMAITSYRPMSRTKFTVLQELSTYGGMTLESVLSASLDVKDRDQMDALVRNAYGWAKALQALVPDAVRVWKDRNYRCSLCNVQKALAPINPAGEVDSPDVAAAIASGGGLGEGLTYTVETEVCCCDSFSFCDTYMRVCTNGPDDCPILSFGGPCSWSCF